jgi:hypothetical protein
MIEGNNNESSGGHEISIRRFVQGSFTVGSHSGPTINLKAKDKLIRSKADEPEAAVIDVDPMSRQGLKTACPRKLSDGAGDAGVDDSFPEGNGDQAVGNHRGKK